MAMFKLLMIGTFMKRLSFFSILVFSFFPKLLLASSQICQSFYTSFENEDHLIPFNVTRLTRYQRDLLLALPSDYETRSGNEKRNLIWEKIENTKYDLQTLPTFYDSKDLWGYLKAFLSLPKAFNNKGDFLNPNRVKFIHSVGSVGLVRFIPIKDSPYTGLLKTPSIGLVRMSTAAPPSNDSFMPGAAIKFFIDGKSSVNMHLMPSLEGQGPNHNYFASNISNHLEKPKSIALKGLALYFRIVRNPLFLPIDQLGRMESNGTMEINPVSPDIVIFKPSQDVKDLIPANTSNDFRVDLNKIPKGVKLWDVYSSDLKSNHETLIGSLFLESDLIPSLAGDRLYFRHQGGK